MKQSIRIKLISAVLLLAGIAIISFAVIKSSQYQAPVKPALTQQAIAKRIAQTNTQPKATTKVPTVSAPTASPATKPMAAQNASNAQAVATTQQSANSNTVRLVNTGPGAELSLFAISAVTGTGGYQLYLRRRLQRV